MKLKIMAIIMFLLTSTVFVSGCTDPAQIFILDPKTDIISDGEFIGEDNGPPGEWFLNGNLQSLSGTGYSVVKIELTAYDSQGNVVGKNNATIDDMTDGYGSFETVINVISEPDHINFVVLYGLPI